MNIPKGVKKPITDEMFEYFVECYDRQKLGVELSARMVCKEFKVNLSHCRWRHECVRRGFKIRHNNVIRKIMRLRAAGFPVDGLPEEFERTQKNKEALLNNRPSMRQRVFKIIKEKYGGNKALGIR